MIAEKLKARELDFGFEPGLELVPGQLALEPGPVLLALASLIASLMTLNHEVY